jgi:hypothetical protein
MGTLSEQADSAPESGVARAQREAQRIAIDVKPQPAAEHPRGQELVRIWAEARAAGQPMTRGDVPSRKLLKLMPHLFLLEPNADGTDWRFRLAGTAIGRRFGADPTGALISQIYDRRQADDQAAIYKRVVSGNAPHVTQGRIEGIDRQFLKIEFCHLPLLPPGQGLNWLLGGVFVFEQS